MLDDDHTIIRTKVRFERSRDAFRCKKTIPLAQQLQSDLNVRLMITVLMRGVRNPALSNSNL